MRKIAITRSSVSTPPLALVCTDRSTASKRAWPNASTYHASKWGLLGFPHALHAELRPLNIKVTVVITGGMRIPFLLDRFPDIDVNLAGPDQRGADRAPRPEPTETVIPQITVLPIHESSWP